MIAMKVPKVTRYVAMYGIACMTVLTGCSRDEAVELGENDRRYAAFYADYLVLSGVSSDGNDSEPVPEGEQVDSLLIVHGLTLFEFNERSDAYSSNPGLWRAVLLEVKNRLKAE